MTLLSLFSALHHLFSHISSLPLPHNSPDIHPFPLPFSHCLFSKYFKFQPLKSLDGLGCQPGQWALFKSVYSLPEEAVFSHLPCRQTERNREIAINSAEGFAGVWQMTMSQEMALYTAGIIHKLLKLFGSWIFIYLKPKSAASGLLWGTEVCRRWSIRVAME